MLTAARLLKIYGEPGLKTEGKYMVLWDVDADINAAIPALPNKIYCNLAMVQPLQQAFRNIIARGLTKEVKTWDGCYQVRRKRGQASMSIHSWGLAIDINAAWNAFGAKPTMSQSLVGCFRDAGFDWGGTWSKPDGMHFQLATLPV